MSALAKWLPLGLVAVLAAAGGIVATNSASPVSTAGEAVKPAPETTVSTTTRTTTAPAPAFKLGIMEKIEAEKQTLQFGTRLDLKITGRNPAKPEQKLGTAPFEISSLVVYLNDVEMTGLKVTGGDPVPPPKEAKTEADSSKASNQGDQDSLIITLWLERSTDPLTAAANQAAWQKFLSTLRGKESPVSVRIGCKGGVPSNASAYPAAFLPATSTGVYLGAILCWLAAMVYFGTCRAFLRDQGEEFSMPDDQPAHWKYLPVDQKSNALSLSRVQAFWWAGLTLLSVCHIAWVSDHFELNLFDLFVPFLTAIATASAAVLIDHSGDTSVKPQIDAEVAAALVDAADPAKVKLAKEKIQPLAERLKPMPRRQGSAFHQLASDGTGISFLRVQVILWTLVLTVIITYYTATQLGGPPGGKVLDAMILICNAAYVAGKFREQP